VSALSQRRVAEVSEASLDTFWSFVLALQVPDGIPAAGSGDVIEILLETNPINQVVFAILVIFSVLSWAIVLLKSQAYRKVERQTTAFLGVFRRSQKFSEVQAACSSLGDTPLSGVFLAGYAELNAQFRLTGAATEAGGRPALKSLEAVDRALTRAAATEIAKLERRLPFLATTATITPFIGLFGTVIGIMIAFQRIGATGSTNLAVVAPGISEALIATAAGLFAAIPAVYFYNHFNSRVKEISGAMDDFALEFLNITERNFT
jgi:biopolymer transport protein TolQ